MNKIRVEVDCATIYAPKGCTPQDAVVLASQYALQEHCDVTVRHNDDRYTVQYAKLWAVVHSFMDNGL